MTDQHSPGPFSTEIAGDKTYIVDRDGQRIAHVFRIKSLPVEANAELFAQAWRIPHLEGYAELLEDEVELIPEEWPAEADLST